MSVVSDTTCGTGGAMSPVPFGEMLMRTPEKIMLSASITGDSPIIPSQDISFLHHKKTEQTRDADYVTEQGDLSSDDESAMSQSVLINITRYTPSYTTTDTNNGEKVTHGLHPPQAGQDHRPRRKASTADLLQQPVNTQILDQVFGDRRTCSTHESGPGAGAPVEDDRDVGGRTRPGGTPRCESQTTLPASEEFSQEVSSAERTSDKRLMDSLRPNLTGKAERCSLKQSPTGSSLVTEELQKSEHANLALSKSQGSKRLDDSCPATQADPHSATARYRHSNTVSVFRASNMSPSQKPESSMTVDYSSKKVGMPRTVDQLRTSVSELRTSASDQNKGRLPTTSQMKTSDTEAMMEMKRRYQSIEARLQNNPDSRLVYSMAQEVREMQTGIKQTNQQHRQEREQLVEKIRRRSLSKADKKHLKQDLQDLGVRQRHLVAVVRIHKEVSNEVKTILAGFHKADADKVQKIQAPSRQRNSHHSEECSQVAEQNSGKPTLTPSRPMNSIREFHHISSLFKDSSAFSSGNQQDFKQTTPYVDRSSPRLNIDSSHQNQIPKVLASQEVTFHGHRQPGQTDRYTVTDSQDSKTNGSKEALLSVSSNLPQKKSFQKDVSSSQSHTGRQTEQSSRVYEDSQKDLFSQESSVLEFDRAAVDAIITGVKTSQSDEDDVTTDMGDNTTEDGDMTVDREDNTTEDGDMTVDRVDNTTEDGDMTVDREGNTTEDGDTTVDREGNTTEDGDMTVDREGNTTEDGDMTVDREEFTGEGLNRGAEHYNRLNKEVNINRQHDRNDQHRGISVGGLSEGNTSGGSVMNGSVMKEHALKRINEISVESHSCEVSSKKRKTDDGLQSSGSQLVLPDDRGQLVFSTSTAGGTLERAQTPSGGPHSISMSIPSVRAHIQHSKDSGSMLPTSVPSRSGSSTSNSSSLGPPTASRQNEELFVPALKSSKQLRSSSPSGQMTMDEVSASKASQVKYTSSHDVRISPIKKDLSARQTESSPCRPDLSRKSFTSPPSLHQRPMEERPPNTTAFSQTVTSPCSTAASSDVFPVSCREIVRKMEARSALARQTQKKQDVQKSGSAADYIAVPIGKVADFENIDTFPKTNENTPKERCCVTSKHTFIQPSVPQELNKIGYGIKKTDLATMVDKGLLTPGKNVMSVKTKTRVFRGSLTDRGTIVGSGGEMFRTPTAWFQRVTGATVVKTTLAYSRVMYKGRPLSSFELVPNTKPTSYNIQPYPANVKNQHRLGSFPAFAKAGDVTILPGKVIGTPHTASLKTAQTSCSRTSTISSLTRSRTVGETLSKILWSNCTIRLIDDAEIVPCPEIDAKFWKTDFKDVRMSDNLWKSVDCWN